MPEPVEETRRRGARAAAGSRPHSDADGSSALLSSADAGDLRQRWEVVQTMFVDDPRGAVEDADALVTKVLERLTDTFAAERSALQERSGGDEVDTEALRVAFQRYRAFFERLLSA